METPVVTPVVETPVVTPAKKKNKRKDKVVKEVKRSAGRPSVYNPKVVLRHLKKYEGKPGGLKKAHEALQKLKGFENISYMTLAIRAMNEKISFGRGKPKLTEKEKAARAAA